MPSSDAAAGRRWRRALAAAAGALLLALAAIVGRVVWFDAYWLFRESPPWLAQTGGGNRLLDRQTRRAKVLQAMTRDYEVALVGSSTVYHGLDPRDVAPDLKGRVFNAGISALVADELPVVASVVRSRRGVERVVLGLDYFMFSRRELPAVRLSRSLLTASGRWNALLGSLVSEYAIRDSFLHRVAGAEDPGAWTRDGFRITPPLPPELTLRNDETRRRTTAPYRPETLARLDEALAALRGRSLTVYLAPVSPAQRRLMAELDLLDDFARWRTDTAQAAGAHGARFLDLADLGADHPFDPREGSNEVWLDNLHYTPVLGRQILERVGLRGPGQPE
ncbi:SGNH/GDSL hydrolase family protein [Enterovirga aerilata]|uniref:SGNH/GDSL hydrolase family protein n=1 Tax=Enterovirga aerilata TaxID=2730920 RepID=A0A849IG81_9HYPH|nr:SGNH/GDSL hydrolase family protein [Enterovirga sp. DB1703]NNM74957.1 SGNH/GDSL hydrolase family protein [Enterovirga sp. DB1703]